MEEIEKNFIAHFDRIKERLDIDPQLKMGEEASAFIASFKSRYAQNGGYDPISDTVAVIDLERIGTLAHEMRHSWQYKNKEKYRFDFSKETTNLISYMVSRKEWNANYFAFRYCWKARLYKTAISYFLTLLGSAIVAGAIPALILFGIMAFLIN